MDPQPRNETPTEVGWGLVGTGRVASQVADALQASTGARAMKVLSRDPERGRSFAAKHGVAETCTSLDELVHDDRIEVVYVASPNGAHVEQVVAAAAASKHVLCEKPMANDLAGCREMAEACQEAGVQLGIGFQYRQHPAHIDIRAAIREGRIGTPLVADASICLPPMVVPQWYDDQGMAAGGVVPMSGIHRLDLLAFVLDQEVRTVAATTRARGDLDGYEEVACAVLEFDRGVTSTVRFAMNAPHGGDGLAIHGTEGSIRATGTTTQWWGGGGGEVVLTSSVGTHTSSYAAVDLYQRQVDGFQAMLRGDDSTVARAADGAAAVSVAHAIRESGRTRRHVSVTPTGIEKEETP